MRSCAVIYNPNSGKGKKNEDFVNTVDEILKQHDYEGTFFKTKKEKDTIEIVSKLDDGFDLVILAGGDGTLNEGITGNLMREKKLLLAALPVGTVNDVGTMYGFTKNLKVDLELLLNGVVKTIDTCLINQHPFIYVACLGNYVDVPYATPRNLKEKYGKWGYLLYGSKKIKEKIKRFDIEYEVNGESYEDKVSFIFITNSSRVAGIDNIYQDVKLNDQKFEVAFCKAKNKTELIRIIPSLLTIGIKENPGIDYYRTNHLKIKFKDFIEDSWCVDGEEYHSKETIFEIQVQNDMQMLVPSKNVEKLFTENEE